MNDDQRQRRDILDALAACDTATLQRLDALLRGSQTHVPASDNGYLNFLRAVAESDITGLISAERSYGNSWKRRGGVDTFHMLTRKWDRVEKRVATNVDASASPGGAAPYDIFEHVAADPQSDGLVDDIRDLRRYLMLVEAEIVARTVSGLADSDRAYLDHLRSISQTDIKTIEEKEQAYGSSWKRRGGIAAFMMLARKWDRIEQRTTTSVPPADGAPGAARDNVFDHIIADRRTEGIIDDIRDLRRYLLLVEAELAARGVVQIGTSRDNREKA